MSFESIAKELGRSEVAVAAIFYGQTQASSEDVEKLSGLLGVPQEALGKLTAYPDRGRSGPMPPVEPLIYRLYEIVQNYGYAYKAVINEKFGDGIMSAIAFSTKVEKEVDPQGVAWVNISMRGKWCLTRNPLFSERPLTQKGSLSRHFSRYRSRNCNCVRLRVTLVARPRSRPWANTSRL